jgi:hypothetical protein
MQSGIKSAKSVVIVGGGAAGVEVATDAKDLYPEKKVTIVHSRDALMHRFGKELQEEALEGMKKLGVEVILGERVVAEDAVAGTVTLRSGKVLECDKFVSTRRRENGSLHTLTGSSGQLYRSEAHFWHYSGPLAQLNCQHRTHPRQTNASNRGRAASKCLRLWRRSRYPGPDT